VQGGSFATDLRDAAIIEIERLTSERDEADTAGGRHLALLIQQRMKTRAIAEAAHAWLKQRDEARVAARWLVTRTTSFDQENEAIAKWPWLDYHA